MTPTLTRRLLVPPMILSLSLLAGCAATDSGSAGTGLDVSAAPTPGATVGTPSTDPGTPDSTPAQPSDTSDLGTVVVNVALGINALDSPEPALPTHVEVSGAEDLATTYEGVPGIDRVVATVAASPPTPGERLFVYVVAACSTDDVSLRLRGGDVTMVVSGTTTLKCEPPPLQMVVWRLAVDEVPADAMPAEAIQK